MAGLNTAGFADGFMTGFNFVDSYYRKNKAEARQEALDKERRDNRDEDIAYRDSRDSVIDDRYEGEQEYRKGRDKVIDGRYNREQKYRADRDKVTDERYEGEQDYRRGRDKVTDERYEEEQDYREKRDKVTDEKSERILGIQESGEKRAQSKFEQEEVERLGGEGWAIFLSGGDLTPEQMEFFEENDTISPERFLGDNMRQAADHVEQLVGQAMENNWTDDDVLVAANTPETLTAVNSLFDGELQKGDGEEKRIVAIVPGQKEGTLAFEIEFTDADGNRQRAPITDNRLGSDEFVKEVSVEDFMGRLSASVEMNNMVKSMPKEARDKAIQFAVQRGMLAKPDDTGGSWKKGNDYTLFNDKTAETRPMEGAGLGGGAGGVRIGKPATTSATTSAIGEFRRGFGEQLGGKFDKESGMINFDKADKNTPNIAETLNIGEHALDLYLRSGEGALFESRAQIKTWAKGFQRKHSVPYTEAYAQAKKDLKRGASEREIENAAFEIMEVGQQEMRAAAEADLNERISGGSPQKSPAPAKKGDTPKLVMPTDTKVTPARQVIIDKILSHPKTKHLKPDEVIAYAHKHGKW